MANSKFATFMRSFNVSCSDHSEFNGVCSNCWAEIHKKFMDAGGHNSVAGKQILDTISFASQLTEDEWTPTQGIGEWNDKMNCHNRGWSRELFDERKERFNKYYGVRNGK